MQSRSRRKKRAFTRAVQVVLRILGSRGPLSIQSVSAEDSQGTSPHDDIPSSIHPQLESFYAKVAGVRNLRERLADYQTEYEEELANRQLRRDEGLIGDPADLAGFAAEALETPAEQTPSFPGLEPSVITPATMPPLQLEQMPGGNEEQQVRYMGEGLGDMLLFYPVQRRANEAGDRVNE